MNNGEIFRPVLILEVRGMWRDYHPSRIADRLSAKYGVKLSETHIWNIAGMARRLDMDQ